MNLTLVIILFGVAGIAGFGVVGMANSMAAISGINEIRTMEIVDNHAESLRFIDWGTSTTISSVDLRFLGSNNFWSGRTVTVDIYDIDGTLIGTGSVVANNNRPTVSLSDTVTAAERPDLRRVVITST